MSTETKDESCICFGHICDLLKMNGQVRKCPALIREFERVKAEKEYEEKWAWLLFGDDEKKWCWRCIEDWEDEEGQEHEGEKVEATCEECGVCADCEHGMECSQSNNGVETAEDRSIASSG